MNNLPAELLETQIKALSKRIAEGSKIFNSKNFVCSMTVHGLANNDEMLFHTHLSFDSNDPEVRKFFEQYTTRLAADRINLQIELNKLQKVEGEK